MWPPSRGAVIGAILALAAVAAGASAALYSGWNANTGDGDDAFKAVEMLTLRFPDGWDKEPARPPGALLTLPKPAPPPPPEGPTRPLTRMSATEFQSALERLEAYRRAQRPANALFNDAQIASIRKRLALTAAQQKHWPPMEEALRRLTWLDTGDGKPPLLDPESAKPLQEVADRFIAVLTERQKRDIRMLANVGGLKLGL